MPIGPARRCLTTHRPSRRIQTWTSSAINRRRSVVDCRSHLQHLPSSPGAVNTRPTAVAVYIALADSERVVATFLLTRRYASANVCLSHAVIVSKRLTRFVFGTEVSLGLSCALLKRDSQNGISRNKCTFQTLAHGLAVCHKGRIPRHRHRHPREDSREDPRRHIRHA